MTGNCSLVKCPPVEVCPEDSYRLPSLVEPKKQGSHHQGGSCCPSTSSHKCQCIPDLLCAPKECPLGWLAHVSKNATGKPGECCPKFQCFPSGSGKTQKWINKENSLWRLWGFYYTCILFCLCHFNFVKKLKFTSCSFLSYRITLHFSTFYDWSNGVYRRTRRSSQIAIDSFFCRWIDLWVERKKSCCR